MSTTIDQRVVEMRFDNKHFENNVKETMSTLDKLKMKLQFKNSAKSLENINTSVNKVNMSGLASAVDTVGSRFSALEVIGVTALANITNSAVNAGKRMISALTIDPITSGFSEYETKMGSIQTILANTEHQGTTMDDVTAALEELNTYADKTIYNFQEMTRNIGTFTAAGVNLKTSVESIKGIANLAAVSGSTSQQASTAMYQLSQALATGTVKLQDWNSVVNAGMGGKVFQNALIRTAAMLDGSAQNVEAWQKKNVDSFGSFRDSLTEGAWLTTEVLTETLKQFTMAAEEGSEEWEAFKKSLKDKGYTEEQAVAILKMANTATDAATKVKKFTQLFDTLKETAQSGWAQTWELIFGDFEEAKEFFSGLSDMLGGLIDSMSNFRNKILGGALNSNWDVLISKINKAGIKTTDFEEAIRSVWKASGRTDKELDDLIEEFGSLEKAVKKGAISSDILKKALEKLGLSTDGSKKKVAGFVNGLKEIERTLRRGNVGKDVKKLQTALKELGYDLGKPGIDGIIGPITEKAIKKFQKEHNLVVDGIAGPKTLAALKEAGTSIEKIADNASDAGQSYNDLIDNITKKGGRELFLESFSNIVNGVVGSFRALGSAWADIFPASGASSGILKFLEKLNSYTSKLRLFTEETDKSGNKVIKFNETGQKLVRTFKGVFAIIDLIATVAGGVFKIAFTVLETILGTFNLDILGFTAILGDAIVKFRDFVKQFNPVVIIVKKLTPLLIKMGKAVSGFVKELWNLPAVQNVITKIANAFSKLDELSLDDLTSMFKKLGNIIKEVFRNINKHFNGAPGNMLSGLSNGLKNGIGTVVTAIIELGKKLVDKFCEILGIHSPSTVFYAIGGFIIAGLIGGLLAGIPSIGGAAGDVVNKITEFFKNTNWGEIFSKIFASGMSVGLLMVAKNTSDILKNISAPLGGLGDLFSGVGEVLEESAKGVGKILKQTAKVVKSFSKIMNSIAFKNNADGIKTLSISLLILVGAIYIMTKLDVTMMWNAVGIIAALAVILGLLTWALNAINNASVEISKNGVKFDKAKTSLFSIGAALLMMGAVVKMMGNMNQTQIDQGLSGLKKIVIALLSLIAAYGLLIKGKGAQNMDKAGTMLKKMATTLLLMAIVVKLISFLQWTEMGKAAVFLIGFTAFVAGLISVTSKASKNIDKVGIAISKISWALLLMVGVVKLVSMLEWGEMGKGAAFLAGFVVFVGLLVDVSTIGQDNQIAKVGSMMLGISAAMLIMVGVVKLIGVMDVPTLVKGLGGIIIFGIIIASLLKVVKSIGPEAPKLAGTLLAMSIAIGVLAATAIVLSLISIPGLAKGVIAVGMLGLVLRGLILATRGASDVKGSIIAMSVAIGIMAASIALLSFIDWKKLAPATIAIGTLMGVFALIESQSKHVTGSMGCLIVMGVVITLLAAVLFVLSKLPVEQTLGTAISLSTMLVSLAVVLKILSTIGPLASAAYPAMLALAVFIVGLIALLAAIGALVTYVPKIKEFLSTGLSIMIQVAEGLGEMIGAFIKGALIQISGALPVIGANLSLFMTNLTPFITGAKTIDGKVLAGVGWLAAAMLILTAVEVISGITSIFSLGTSLSDIGTELSNFMINALPFIMTSRLIDPAIMQGVKALAEAILMLTAADLLDGIHIFSQTPLEKFSEQLPILATGLKGFITNLGSLTEDQVATAVNAANIIKTLAQAASEIPNSGGLLGSLVGENDMGPWAQQLPIMAQGIAGFIKVMADNGITEDSVKVASTAANIIKTLANAASEIPNTGGLLADLIGDNDLSTFAVGLPIVGVGIAGFVKTLRDAELTQDDVSIANTAAEVIKSLATAAQAVPNTGGWLADLIGDNDLATFAEGLPDVGTGIAGFVENLGTFDASKLDTVKAATKAIEVIANMSKNYDKGDDSKDFSSFGKGLVTLAKKVKDFIDEMSDVTAKSIDTAISNIKKLLNFAANISNSSSEALKNFGESLKKVAKDGVKKFIDEINSKTNISDAEEAGGDLVNAVIDGAEDKESDVEDAFEGIAETAVDNMCTKTLKEDAASAGKDLVTGFANGIKNNKKLATDAGSSLGKAALKAAKEAIDSNSPSKEAMYIGNYFGEGFVIGIQDYATKTYDTAYNVGKLAKTGLSKAIAKVSALIDSGVDTEPKIRPVLDLSDVENGASYLNSMFNNGPAIGVSSNLNAISSSMNNRLQNGTNSDVVSAIDGLRKDLSNIGGNTYNVNGITYDDGSNITNAVRDLVKAAQIERRI